MSTTATDTLTPELWDFRNYGSGKVMASHPEADGWLVLMYRDRPRSGGWTGQAGKQGQVGANVRGATRLEAAQAAFAARTTQDPA